MNSSATNEEVSNKETPTNNNMMPSINNDDISLPLSLIKGLRRKRHHHSVLDSSSTHNPNAMDSSSSSNTSDKDDSGGDEEADGSNTSSRKQWEGAPSSLSGSEQETAHAAANQGILRTMTKHASFSSSDGGIVSAGDDVLSERVVVRGSAQEPIQCKVSFAEGHFEGGDQGCAKRRKKVEEADTRQMTNMDNMDPRCFENGSFQLTEDQTRNNRDGNGQMMGQIMGNLSHRVTSSSSYATGGSNGQTPGQESSSSSSYQQQSSSLRVDTPIHMEQTFSPTSPSSPSKHENQDTSEERRIERNQREKERSNKIASQVDALRCLLQRGGLFIPKNTKSSVLYEASNYIRTLQDRHRVMSSEMEGLKRQLLEAVEARGQAQQIAVEQVQVKDLNQDGSGQDYHLIFNNTMAGMAVASMGGTLLDCNVAFQKETGLSSSDLSDLTIFNIIHTSDLSRALKLISSMIDEGYVGGAGNGNQEAPQVVDAQDPPEPLMLRSSFQNRPDLGLCVTLVHGDDAIAKYFSITLVKNVPPSSDGARLKDEGLHSVPYNPSIPSFPSMVRQSSASLSSSPSEDSRVASKPQVSFHHPIPVVPNIPQANPISINNATMADGNGLMTNSSISVPSPLAAMMNLASRPVSGMVSAQISVPQAPVLQAPMLIPQIAAPAVCASPPINSTIPGLSPQLLQLLLLSQQQQQLQQFQPMQPQSQTQNSPLTPNLQHLFSVVQQPQFQQQPQQPSVSMQLPIMNSSIQRMDPSLAATANMLSYWNQNVGLLPDPSMRQLVNPFAPDASPQGNNYNDSNGGSTSHPSSWDNDGFNI